MRDQGEWRTLSKAQRGLLAILVAAGPRGLSLERLADELWPTLPKNWRPKLRVALSRLRGQLTDGGGVVNDHGWCRLDLGEEDVDLWSLWAAAREGSLDLIHSDDLVDSLVGEPFSDVEIRAIVREAIETTDRARFSILAGQAGEAALALTTQQLERLRFAASQPGCDPLLASQISRLDLAHEERTHPWLASRMGLIGFDQVVAGIERSVRAGRGCRLNGQPGSGLRALLGAVGDLAAASGHRVIRLESGASFGLEFGPLVAAIPELREEIGELYASKTEGSTQRASKLALALLNECARSGAPVLVVGDDIDSMDEGTISVLGNVLRSQGPESLAAVLGSTLRGDASMVTPLPLEPITVPTLSSHSIEQLALRQGIEATPLQLSALVTEVAARTKGRAGSVVRFLEQLDSETLLPTGPRPDLPQLPVWMHDRLSTQDRKVIFAASAIGRPVTIAELAEASGVELSDPALFEPLLATGILIQRPGPSYESVDWCDAAAIRRLVLPHDMRRICVKAAAFVTEPLEAAMLLELGGDLVSAAEVQQAYLEAGRSSVDRQDHRLAAQAFEGARRTGEPMSPSDLIRFAIAVERIGADAQQLRDEAMEVAQSTGNDRVALRAALAGLPEAEHLDGDPRRVSQIESVNPARLDRSLQHEHACALSRQLLLCGREDEARRWASISERHASSPNEMALSWLTHSHTDGWQTKSGRFVPADFLDQVENPILECRVLQTIAVDALISGHLPTAASASAQLSERAEQASDPLRTWHAALIAALVAEQGLELRQADEIADAALHRALAAGISGAWAARRAQQLRRSWAIAGSDHVLASDSAVGMRPDEGSTSFLARAGALVLTASLSPEAAPPSEAIARLLDDSGNSRFGIAVAGILTSAAQRADSDVREQLIARLSPKRGTNLIIGAGVSSLGPVDRLIAMVELERNTRRALHREAITQADHWETPMWRLQTRLSLLGEESDPIVEDEAQALAARHGLEMLATPQGDFVVQRIGKGG